MSEIDRIAHLETVVRALYREVGELRAEIAALRGETVVARPAGAPDGGGAPAAQVDQDETSRTRDLSPPIAPAPLSTNPREAAPQPLPSRSPASPPARSPRAPLDLESLLGRYGTIALATLAILMGAGAFLTWAVAHGLLGPTERVVLGAIGAGLVAALGTWLRARGTVRFGNVLLALALALVHLDAWAAGPRLHVISAASALLIAAATSAALAALALRAGEETLFAVGLGGALLAPFVTSTGAGKAAVLAAYGWVVIAGGLVALRRRDWRTALWIIGLGCLCYALVTHGLVSANLRPAERHLPVLFAFACAAAALAWGAQPVRALLTVAFLAVGLVVQLAIAVSAGQPALTIPLAGTLMAYAALYLDPPPVTVRLVGAVFLPLGFLAAAVDALASPGSVTGALVALLWTALALVAAWRSTPARELHLVTGAMASGAAVLLGLHGHPALCIAVLAVHAAACATVLERQRAPALAVPLVLGLTIASVWAYLLLERRPAYGYLPLLTTPSAVALAAVAAWWVVARAVLRLAASGDGSDEESRAIELAGMLGAAPWVAAFLWIREELVRAFAPDIATFLIIIFYAAAGVGAIFYGRRRAHAAARGIGLALAFYGGIKALVQAWDITAIGLRVGSCVLVGLFIALVSYWYRAPDSVRNTAEPQPTGN